MDFFNVYEDEARAESYAKLDFPGTYYLAFRDLPMLMARHVKGAMALDFGCGAGRSTRFLSRLGFEAVGVDISPDMLRKAKEIDPSGDYRLVKDGDLRQFAPSSIDAILAAFTFDNIPTAEQKVRIMRQLADLMAPEGRFVNLVSSPDIYRHEWASFSARDFPENQRAGSGDRVRIVMTDVDDRRPVEDVMWSHEAYQEVYSLAGLKVVEVHRPLGSADEPYPWVNETRIPPWTIYVLAKA